MSKEQNYAEDVYALKNKYYLEGQARNKSAYEAKDTWWNKLQEWEGQPGYGGIPVDWADMWDRAQEKVRYSYWGGPGGQIGTADKVKASAARRGVSDSPALQTQLSRMGMQEGAEIRNLASTQALAESAYGEAGRQNWLASIQNLAGSASSNTPPMPMYLPEEQKGEWDWGGMIEGAIGGATTGSAAGPWGTLIGGVVGAGAGGAKGLLDTTSHEDMNLGGALNAYASGSSYGGGITGSAGAAKESGGGGIMSLISGLLGGNTSEGGDSEGGGLDIASILKLVGQFSN